MTAKIEQHSVPRRAGLVRLRRQCLGVGAALLGVLAGTNPALSGAYTVQQGDTIEVDVSGLPELRHRSNVQPDGAISVPLLGALKVEGMTPAELRLEIQNQLAGKVYRLHSNDGHEILTVIEAEEVSAEIVGYRPIYVAGDVAHPGQQEFRPQMTVRQALALAGGPDDPASRNSKATRDSATVKSECDIAQAEMARAAVRAARLQAQLNDSSQMPPVKPATLGLSLERVVAMLQDESDILSTTMSDYHRERDFLSAVVTQAADQIAVVEKQRVQEQEGSQADSAELQRMIDLLSHGQEINPRVTDARRALLLSSTRTLQVSVQLLELKRQRAEGERNVARLVDGRRIAWLNELQEATSARMIAAEKVHALHAELSGSELSHFDDRLRAGRTVDVEVFRQDGARSLRSEAGDDFQLEPGDTIKVTTALLKQSAEQSPSQ